MSMSKVFLNAGHGGRDNGAVKYLVEKDINLKMARACRDYLTANNVEVLMGRDADIDRTSTQITNMCNSYNPDCAVDIHNNAGGGDGFEVYHSINPQSNGIPLAKAIEAEVIKIGQNSRGCKAKKGSNGDYYYFIRNIACPSVICEGVFVDNKADAAQADTDEECRAFGEAYAKGILKYLGIDAVSPTETKTSIPESGSGSPSGSVLYCVQTGAYSKKANADAQAAKMKAKGFEVLVKNVDGMYKVQTGAYSKKANADAQLAKVKAAGFDAFITTNGGSSGAFAVGKTVKVKSTATKYATGQTIPDWVKSQKYTVQQINGSRALLKEITSWVNLDDLELS